jgi:hypothetical protein
LTKQSKNSKVHPLYNVWRGIKRRCSLPSDSGYAKCGALGIRIDPEWEHNPKAFISWGIQAGWKPGTLIDRIDRSRNYTPENCRFVERKDKVFQIKHKPEDGTGYWKGDNKEKRSTKAKEAAFKITPEVRSKRTSIVWDRMSEDQRKLRSSKVAKSKASNQLQTNKKIAESVKKHWDEASYSYKSKRIKAALKNGRKEYLLIDGSVCKFDSSWEASTANVLIKLGIKYQKQKVYHLGKHCYLADFYLPDYNIIIEVKGRPQAWKRWYMVTVPSLVKHLDRSIQLFVVGFSAKTYYLTLNQFLSEAVPLIIP